MKSHEKLIKRFLTDQKHITVDDCDELLTERQPLDYYLNLGYPVTITPDAEGGFVAEIEDLPGCFTQGETLEETYENMEKARRLWLETAYEDGMDIPLPRDSKQYSGKFNVRVPKNLTTNWTSWQTGKG